MVFPQSSERGEVAGDGDGHSVLQLWAARSRSRSEGISGGLGGDWLMK